MNLIEVAEIFWLKMFPNGSNTEASVKKETIIAAAKAEYSYITWVSALNMRNAEGEYTVPSQIVESEVLPVVDGIADISALQILTGIPQERWAISLKGKDTKTEYIKTTAAGHKSVDREDLPNPRYFISSRQIHFPDEVNDKNVIFYYAGMKDVDDYIPISGEMGSMIDTALTKRYGLRETGKEDKTINQNPDL